MAHQGSAGTLLGRLATCFPRGWANGLSLPGGHGQRPTGARSPLGTGPHVGTSDAVCSRVVGGSFLRTHQSSHSRSRTPGQKLSTPIGTHGREAWPASSRSRRPAIAGGTRRPSEGVRRALGRARPDSSHYGRGCVSLTPASRTGPGPSSPSRHLEHTCALGNITSVCVCLFAARVCA